MVKANQFKLFAMVAAILLCLLALVAVQPAEAAFSGDNGEIAFQSARHVASGEIYTIVPGKTATRITFSNGSADPAYSPDGSRIAFVSTNNQIFVMNADGSGRRQVTKTSTAKQDPAWSPDGTQIAYVANSFDVDKQTDLEIWTINADGSGLKQLTNNSPFSDTQPAWSPLGNKIAFVSARTGDTDNNVYIMNSNGSGQTNITPNSPPDCSSNCYQRADDDPAWSPDGSKIAYVHGYGPPDNPFAGGGVPNIWTMNPDGSSKTNVSNDEDTSAFLPAWSPDGAKIAYVGVAPSSNQDIYVMNANGSRQAPIDTNAAKDEDPYWQPVPVCTATVNSNNAPLLGTASNDVLCGNNLSNVINGAGGNDIILAGGGNDKLTGGLGNDTINGGPGKDTALYSGSARVVANLTTEFAKGVGMDVLLGIENLSGSNAKDTLTGSASTANVLSGLGGNDVLNVRDGTSGDTVVGGTGTDTCRRDARDVRRSCP